MNKLSHALEQVFIIVYKSEKEFSLLYYVSNLRIWCIKLCKELNALAWLNYGTSFKLERKLINFKDRVNKQSYLLLFSLLKFSFHNHCISRSRWQALNSKSYLWVFRCQQIPSKQRKRKLKLKQLEVPLVKLSNSIAKILVRKFY